jgi:hypothetical protein
VSTAGGEDPHWRPDGKELFYLDPSGRLFAVLVQNSRPNSAFSMGAPQALFDTGLARVDRWIGGLFPGAPSYDVAPDGKRFLVRVIKEHGPDPPLVLVTNWQAGLLK